MFFSFLQHRGVTVKGPDKEGLEMLVEALTEKMDAGREVT
jgi:hypothetical protein